MINVLNTFRIKKFEYAYLIVMIIYMAQMHKATSRMFSTISGDPIPFLLPIVLTIILLTRNPISFYSKKLFTILSIITIWSICIIIKEQLYSIQELSYLFFLYYAVIIAYIHNQIYGYRILLLYEDILTKLCIISIILWIPSVILPNIMSSFFHNFPDVGYGRNFLYLFNWMDPAKGQISILIRNAGCSWEPGRFAIMVVLAIYINLSREGIKFKGNRNIFILLFALLSTQSTTGFSIVLLLYTIFFIKTISFKYLFGSIILIFPIIYGISKLDFMYSKIQDQLEVKSSLDNLQKSIDYSEQVQDKGLYRGSLNRFQAIYFEYKNILEDPILGYSRNTEHSFFNKNISSNFVLTGGILKLLGQFGLPIGLFFYYVLYQSSIAISRDSKVKRKYALFLLFVLSSISYVIFCIPIFTTFWFYEYFNKKK